MSHHPDSSAIIDNRARSVGEFLRHRLSPRSELSVVSAYFTIYAYDRLRSVLNDAARTRFLYGDPDGVGAVDPGSSTVREFGLADNGGIELQDVLMQKPLARECAEWIRNHVEIRTVQRSGFLHGKLYHIKNLIGKTAAVVGSSNFTVRGLGLSNKSNIELNLEVRDRTDRNSLMEWFNELWTDNDLTQDVKNRVLRELERLGQPYAPEFVYYKTLFHIFKDALENRSFRDDTLDAVHLHDTEIWKKLYEFQKHGATTAINRLLKHNGCIIADSVGLGKTWTALAVIKFFELRNERVLVLCPKRLEDNWVRYAAWASSRNNPFLKDRLNYTVLAHTDLSRDRGASGMIDLSNFNWGSFDLVVIDESHNFRNEGTDRVDESGKIVRRSRFNRLLEEVIRDGVRTKVLMLSATPVNTSLRDLRNQVYLITEKQRNAFKDTLGILDIQTMFALAEREFRKWERVRNVDKKASKQDLIENLGSDFLSLLDAITIARSRAHIRTYYPEVNEQIGGFPNRLKPKNLHPPSDVEGELSYDDLHQRIGKFKLAVYMPSKYVRDQSSLDEEKQSNRFDQRDREHWLVGMIRTNLLKRLESSVFSFSLTMKRIIEKIDHLDRSIEAWRVTGLVEEFEVPSDLADDEDEEFIVGNKRRYRLDEINVDDWQRDLHYDRDNLNDIYQLARKVTPQRDAKLLELTAIIEDKIRNPTRDKDGLSNRKVLVFTTFADTAAYLFENISQSSISQELDCSVEVLTGASNVGSPGISTFDRTLGKFAPRAQEFTIDGDETDVLIATDCISEGQNLQDCDLVVNYDIHWNPVRLMQRFGRIDRLGSRNQHVSMVNFWPTKDLNRYLDLQNRVEARMALADATATGVDNLLDGGTVSAMGSEGPIQGELRFRDEQLLRLRNETLDIEEMQDGVSLNDLTLDDFVTDLMRYLERNRDALESAPFGICSVASTAWRGKLYDDCQAPPYSGSALIKPGALFCFRNKNAPRGDAANLLQPYFLVYVQMDGTVRFGYQRARASLALFRALAAGRDQFVPALEDAFDHQTDHGRRMKSYRTAVVAATHEIIRSYERSQRRRLMRDRTAKLGHSNERPSSDVLELVTWLVIMDDPNRAT